MGNLQREVESFINQQNADILCLQEVFSSTTDKNFLKNVNFNSLESILENTDYAYLYFEPAFSFSSMGESIEYGNAILSRLPILERRVVFTSGQYTKLSNWEEYSRNNRNAVMVKVLIDKKHVWIVSHHGFHELEPLGSEDTVRSMSKLSSSLKKIQEPLILAGDLNVIDQSPAMRVFDNWLRDLTAEFKITDTLSQFGKVRNVPCDHILVSSGINVNAFEVSEEIVSDHAALILDFEL